MGRANRFVCLLSAGVFGMKTANFEVIFAKFGFNEIGNLGESLVREIEGVSTVISNVTGLIKALSGGHGGFRAKAKAAIGFNLECSGSKRYWIGFFSFSFFKILHLKMGILELLEEKFGFFGSSESSFIEISFKNFRRIEVGNIGGLVAKFTGDLEAGFCVKVFDFLFALDNEAEGRRLDAAGGFSPWHFGTHDAREVVTY